MHMRMPQICAKNVKHQNENITAKIADNGETIAPEAIAHTDHQRLHQAAAKDEQ